MNFAQFCQFCDTLRHYIHIFNFASYALAEPPFGLHDPTLGATPTTIVTADQANFDNFDNFDNCICCNLMTMPNLLQKMLFFFRWVSGKLCHSSPSGVEQISYKFCLGLKWVEMLLVSTLLYTPQVFLVAKYVTVLPRECNKNINLC